MNDGIPEVYESREVFAMFRRLRKCRRCGHYPCPHCATWCDVMSSGEKKLPPLEPPLGSNIDPAIWRVIRTILEQRTKEEDSEDGECPCQYEMGCLYSYDDVVCNIEVFTIFDQLCDLFKKQSITINGDYVTADGRIVLLSGDDFITQDQTQESTPAED